MFRADSKKVESQVHEAVNHTVEHMFQNPKQVEAKLHMRYIGYNLMASLVFGKT
jgi:hypothetical protein